MHACWAWVLLAPTTATSCFSLRGSAAALDRSAKGICKVSIPTLHRRVIGVVKVYFSGSLHTIQARQVIMSDLPGCKQAFRAYIQNADALSSLTVKPLKLL